MRIAALILGIVLSIVSGLQSMALFAASSISDSLENKSEASDMTSAGAAGAFAAFLMFVAAAFVYAKPKVARVIFAVSALFFVIGGALGFSDGWIWAVVNVALAVAAHFGINEAAKKRERERADLRADLAASLGQQQS